MDLEDFQGKLDKLITEILDLEQEVKIISDKEKKYDSEQV